MVQGRVVVWMATLQNPSAVSCQLEGLGALPSPARRSAELNSLSRDPEGVWDCRPIPWKPVGSSGT